MSSCFLIGTDDSVEGIYKTISDTALISKWAGGVGIHISNIRAEGSKISKTNGKLANDVEIKNGNYEEKEYIVISENDPISTDGKNRWQDAIDKWRGEQGDDKYHYPTEVSDSSKDDVVVSIKNPSGKQKVDNNDIEIRAKIISGEKIKNVKVFINGDEIKSINEDINEVNVSINLEDGAYKLQVVATNEKDKQGESTIEFGVNKEWDYKEETPTPKPTEEAD